MIRVRWRIGTAPAWDDERREVMTGVIEELRNPALDADGLAACIDLLEHLERRLATAYSFPVGCSKRSKSWESRGATSARPPKRHWL
jgi:hypothetical protein